MGRLKIRRRCQHQPLVLLLVRLRDGLEGRVVCGLLVLEKHALGLFGLLARDPAPEHDVVVLLGFGGNGGAGLDLELGGTDLEFEFLLEFLRLLALFESTFAFIGLFRLGDLALLIVFETRAFRLFLVGIFAGRHAWRDFT